MADAAARPEEARRVEARGVQQHPRAEGEERGRAVGLLPDDAGHRQRRVADRERVVDREAEPGEERLLDHDAAAGEQRVERARGRRCRAGRTGDSRRPPPSARREASRRARGSAPFRPAPAPGPRSPRGGRGPAPGPRPPGSSGRAERSSTSPPRSARASRPSERSRVAATLRTATSAPTPARCRRGSRRSAARRRASPARPGPRPAARGRAGGVPRRRLAAHAAARSADDAAVPQLHDPLRVGRERRVVGHQDRAWCRGGGGGRRAARRSGSRWRSRGCRWARRPGGARAVRDRAREGDALLLAARQLRRVVADARLEADLLEEGAGPPRPRSAAPASSSGMATFSRAVSVGIRWNDWKT